MGLLKEIIKTGINTGAKTAKVVKKAKKAKAAPEFKTAKKLKNSRLLKQGAGIASGAAVYFMNNPDKKEKSAIKKVISRAKSASKRKLS